MRVCVPHSDSAFYYTDIALFAAEETALIHLSFNFY